MDNVETLSQTGSDGLRRLVAAQELGAVPRLTAVPEQTRGSLRTRLRRSLTWEIGLVTAVVVGLGVALRTPLAMTLGVLLTSLIVNYYAGLQTVRPGLPHKKNIK